MGDGVAVALAAVGATHPFKQKERRRITRASHPTHEAPGGHSIANVSYDILKADDLRLAKRVFDERRGELRRFGRERLAATDEAARRDGEFFGDARRRIVGERTRRRRLHGRDA